MISPESFCEFIGTASLVFTIQSASSELAPIAIGVVLVALIFAGGPVSGAHYNPAVSLAAFIRGAMTLSDLGSYWISQIVGGTTGAILGGIVCGTYSTVASGDAVTPFQAQLAEVCLTFVLCYTVLNVATNPKVENNHYYGLSIGLVVLSGAISVGPISGGAFNPAVALGLSIASRFEGLSYALCVSVSNLIGGAVGAFCFKIVSKNILSETEPETVVLGESTPLNA